MDSAKWRHTAAIPFFCFIWAFWLVYMCIFVPLFALKNEDSRNHCAPDGSFRLEPINLWAPTWFFQVVLGFGSLNFTAVKAVDILWDVVSDFNNIKCIRQLLTLK